MPLPKMNYCLHVTVQGVSEHLGVSFNQVNEFEGYFEYVPQVEVNLFRVLIALRAGIVVLRILDQGVLLRVP